jgi:hypothetical protein
MDLPKKNEANLGLWDYEALMLLVCLNIVTLPDRKRGETGNTKYA